MPLGLGEFSLTGRQGNFDKPDEAMKMRYINCNISNCLNDVSDKGPNKCIESNNVS